MNKKLGVDDMGSYKKLIGENIYLSPISVEDAKAFTGWMNDFNVTDYVLRSHEVMTEEIERAWLEKTQKNGDCILSIVRKEDDKVIGDVGLHNVNHINRTATLGIFIGDNEDRNKGLGTEAIRLILDFGFNYLNLKNVNLALLECNTRALKCYQKVGFKEYGRRRECIFLNGKYYDEIIMDILDTEFRNEYIKNKEVKE